MMTDLEPQRYEYIGSSTSYTSSVSIERRLFQRNVCHMKAAMSAYTGSVNARHCGLGM